MQSAARVSKDSGGRRQGGEGWGTLLKQRTATPIAKAKASGPRGVLTNTPDSNGAMKTTCCFTHSHSGCDLLQSERSVPVMIAFLLLRYVESSPFIRQKNTLMDCCSGAAAKKLAVQEL